MRAGRLRQRITIQHWLVGSPARSETGQPLGEWVNLYENVPAEWITLTGRSLFAAQAHNAEIRGIWRIRWHAGITEKMRAVDDGLYYDILWVPPYDRKGRRAEMDLECSQGVRDLNG